MRMSDKLNNSTNRSSTDRKSIFLCQKFAANSMTRSDTMRFVILLIELCKGDIGVIGDKYPLIGVMSVSFFSFVAGVIDNAVDDTLELLF